MDGVDPDTLLEWLQTGTGDERDLQLMALEQLCMLLLMSDNIDRCFELCPPRTFIPALCKIFLDETAPENCLEVTARAITYYLDVSNECTRRITQVEGAVKAICNRLAVAEMTDRTSKDLAEQCVKLLEHVCQRETTAVYEAGGLQCMLHLIGHQGQYVHKDTLHSAMNVVTRLCSKMEPQDASLPKCSADLGALLGHDDPKVSECALRCFAALTDRFVRKSLDPVELARPSQLVEHLLTSLLPVASAQAAEAPADANAAQLARPSSFTSIVLSLLSNLCRGSAKVTDQIIRSPKLIPALRSVLGGKDERCVMDSLRLADLLIILLCEGRASLPRNTAAFAGSEPAVPTGVERAHRYLIDAIRQRDTDALIDAVESGTVDPNFTDDVGQTLLNWCSAFGTADMVIYLCDKGADVNKGQRSSSLHYAACFGRPDIVKILLRNGANPDVRDEEGRIALDKARERNDEGHQQVVQILESPSSYMMDRSSQSQGRHGAKEKSETAGPADEPVDPVIAKNILQQLIPVFCNIFKNTLVSGVRRSTLTLIRKCILSISNEALHEMLSASPAPGDDQADLVESLMEVLITVFDHDEDMDGQEQVLLVLKSLLTKDSDFWLEQIVRLGVFDKVEALAAKSTAARDDNENMDTESGASVPVIDTDDAAPSRSAYISVAEANKENAAVSGVERTALLNIPVQSDEDSSSNAPATPTSTISIQSSTRSSAHHGFAAGVVEAANAVAEALGIQIEDEITQRISSSSNQDDAWNVTQGTNYKWKDWRLIRTADSLFLWCDAVAIEFSDGSNGWLRFLMDGKLYTMYSSGSPEAGADNPETRAEFVSKLQKAKAAVPAGSQTRTIFSNPAPGRAVDSGNWVITCTVPNELVIKNQEGSQQRLLIKEDLPGFIFESNKHSRQSFTAESTLGLDFVTGWAARGGGRRLQFRTEAQRQKIHDLARDVWENYLKEARTKPRDALLELQRASAHVEHFVNKLEADAESATSKENVEKLQETLEVVRNSLTNDRLLSTFEISVSGAVPAMLALVSAALNSKNSVVAQCFREVFADPRDFASLVRKMVLVLESVEKFPQCLYDAPGGSAFGLQLLTRRLRFRLELADANSEHQKQLLDRTNRQMKSEPLTTVGSLKSFIHRMVARRWYDYPRENFDFVKKLQEVRATKERVSLTYESDFDDKGVIWWLGTNGKSASEWVNPASVGVVNVVCSDGAKQPYGQPEDVLSREVNALNCHTTDSPDASFTIDLGVLIYPTAYTLRHSRGYGRSALRNWLLQASRDNHVWDFLVAHSDDQSLNQPGSTATWPIACETGQGPYRYIRIAQNGKNSSGVTYYLSLSGFEIYGDIVDVVEKMQPMEIPQSVSSFAAAKDKAAASMPWSKKSGRRYPTATSSSTVPKTLGGVHAARPPTAATALRAARKQQSAFEKPSKSPGSNNSPFGFDADPLYGQLPGGAANHKLAAGYSLASLLGQSSSRNKNQRYRRSNRHYAEAGPPPLPDAPAADFMPQIPIGARVFPGPYWRWGSVTNRQGTVTAVGNPDGWVDVEWDDGTSNSYRYGDGGKREIEMLSAASSSRPSLFTARGQRDSFFRTSNQLGIASRPSVVVKQAPHTSGKPPRSSADRKEESSNFLSSKTANNPATASLREELRSQANASAAANGSGASSSMSQKSMSTTNLFDGKKEVPRSVASTNQAASAESLQHQTPSLENLLARSRIYGEGIPEAVGDEQSPTDGPMDVTTSAESIDSSAHVISVAASSFAGGSQPALSPKTSFAHQKESLSAASSANALSDDVMRTNRDVVSSPREHPASERTLDEAMDDGGKNLSVSAPNLAVGRQRQRVSVGSGTSGPVENNLLFLEEEEPSETDEANESLSDIKEEAFEPVRDAASGQPASEPREEDGIVDIEPDEDNDALDDEFLNKLIRSRDFFGLVDAYSEELALAENDVNEENHAYGQPSAGAAGGQGSSANAASSRRPLSSLFGGTGIRSKLGNYAEVIRNMMQQMMDSGSISGFDSDEIDIRLTDDVYDEDDITDEGNDNEDCDDFALSSQVESLASAAAALRRQFSTASASSQNAATNSQNSNLASSEKLNWRQLVMSEAGRFLYDVAGSGSSSNAGETSAASVLGGDSANTGGRNSKRTVNRTWDDDFVLRRQFGALIPAFDPRPGRTNINQTQDVELPENDVELPPLNHHRNSLMYSSSNTSISGSHSSKIRLCLKGPNLADVPNAVVELDEDDATIFAFVQKLLSLSEWGQKLDKCRRVWEPTYTIIYENPLPDGERSTIEVTKSTNKEVVPESGSLIRQTLDVLKHLNIFAEHHQVDVPQDAFLSTKLTQKLTQELTDCLVVSARSLPEWCDVLVYEYPCLFSSDTRSMHLRSSAFGTSRAIVWLQNRRDQLLEQTRSSGAGAGSNLAGSRREDHYPEYRIGRIRHERIKVHRNDELLLENAIKVMKFHATRKSVLEIEYVGEEGTGLGPTLEFYALVAAEFQRKSLNDNGSSVAMWLCDDADEQQLKLESSELDLGEGRKPPGYYVRRSGGLFPAPLPPDSDESLKVSELFRILGIFLAKVLQDGRLVDFPLSSLFLKLLVNSQVAEGSEPNLDGLLTMDDFERIHPHKANFLRELSNLVERKKRITADERMPSAAKRQRLEELRLKLGDTECAVEDLALTFALNPPSSVFSYRDYELIPNGAEIDVTVENVELYLEKCLDFYLNTGIRQQISAFRQGFDLVFPLRSLVSFSPEEVQTLLSGEQCPEWTREDILKHTEPKLGYTRDSPGFLRFVDVLVGLNAAERKAFLQFTTGCSSLPPGGLANLHPRLTVVRKVDSGDGSYPSVNTCVHYLKLPEYSSAEILRERLLAATNEKGFHLN